MRFILSHLGVPIGELELPTTERAVGELEPAKGYLAIRETIRAASQVLWANGFLGEGTGIAFDTSSLARAQALSLELRDERGAFVPADFINIVERPRPTDTPVVFVQFRMAPSQIPSRRESPEMQGGDMRRRDV
jgi:hypothetical protein